MQNSHIKPIAYINFDLLILEYSLRSHRRIDSMCILTHAKLVLKF